MGRLYGNWKIFFLLIEYLSAIAFIQGVFKQIIFEIEKTQEGIFLRMIPRDDGNY